MGLSFANLQTKRRTRGYQVRTLQFFALTCRNEEEGSRYWLGHRCLLLNLKDYMDRQRVLVCSQTCRAQSLDKMPAWTLNSAKNEKEKKIGSMLNKIFRK